MAAVSYDGRESFGQLPDLTANNFGKEQDITTRKSALKTTDILLDTVFFTSDPH